MADTNIVPLFEQDLDVEEPAPPSQAEIDLSASIDRIVFELEHARGEQIPIRVSMALGELRSRVRNPKEPRPGPADLDRMLMAVERARPYVVSYLDGAYTVAANGHRGMDVLQGLICRWGETPEVRAARHPHAALDIDDLANVFRRELRNAETLQAIQERAALRSADRTIEVWGRLVEGVA